MLKGTALAGAALVLMVVGARAADVQAPPVHDWTGFYAGAYGGVAWSEADIDGTIYNDGEGPRHDALLLDGVNAINDFSLSKTVGTYGVQAGYTYQLDQIVLGLQADFGGLDAGKSDNRSDSLFGLDMAVRDSYDMDWMGTLRARLGILASDKLLLYATGGGAVTSVKFSHRYDFDNRPISFGGESFSDTVTRWGWVVGGGVEYAFAGNWSLGAEYLYADFGSISNTERVFHSNAGPLDTLFENELDLSIQTVRASINYRF